MIAQPERWKVHRLLPLLAVMLVSACAGSPQVADPAQDAARVTPSAAASTPGSPDVREQAILAALAQVGAPYRYGGQSPSTGFDCSGLVHYAYLEAGRSLPRTTDSLWNTTRRVSRSGLQPGDLVFFSIEGKMQHVGLYIGDNRFVHAPSSGRWVSVESLASPFYAQALLSGGRLE
jgi:cell wall-associated NlpC family hydrolase